MENTVSPELIKNIQSELIFMAREDQKARQEAQKNSQTWDLEIDKKNLARLKEIVDQIGLPTISKVGEVASQAAWIIAQHAVIYDDQNNIKLDLEFQENYLALMEEAYLKKDIDPVALCYLRDRVAVSKGEKQIYATQLGSPILDEASVLDKRREMGEFPINIFPELRA